MSLRWVLIFATCAGYSAIAQDVPIYRWVTSDGVTHYSTSPPENYSAEQLDQSRTRLNVVPAPPLHQTTETERIEDPEERINRLQQEVDAMRRQRREDEARALAAEQARVTARINCEERFRQPCNDQGEPISTRTVIMPPQWNRPPAWHPPSPPPQTPPPPSRRPVAPRAPM